MPAKHWSISERWARCIDCAWAAPVRNRNERRCVGIAGRQSRTVSKVQSLKVLKFAILKVSQSLCESPKTWNVCVCFCYISSSWQTCKQVERSKVWEFLSFQRFKLACFKTFELSNHHGLLDFKSWRSNTFQTHFQDGTSTCAPVVCCIHQSSLDHILLFGVPFEPIGAFTTLLGIPKNFHEFTEILRKS